MKLEVSDSALIELNSKMERASAPEIIYWASKTFGDRLAVTTSFQSQSLPLLHLVGRIAPLTKVLFLETGFHFSETLEYAEKIERMLNLRVSKIYPLNRNENQKEERLYESNPTMCCYFNKVEPLQKELVNFDAWISGIRRDQTVHRAHTPILEVQESSLLKICPMARYSARFIQDYRRAFNFPSHPLESSGYLSIGCEPCTKPVDIGKDWRSGRWKGREKTECGLHLKENNNQSA